MTQNSLLETVGGIILCGGASRRMGRAKAWLPIGDELLLQRVVRRLAEMVDPVVVAAAAEQDLPPLPDNVAIIRDSLPNQGPLAGLIAGLNALRARASAVYVTACDVPHLQPAFVARLHVELGTAAAIVPERDGRLEPLAALYRTDLADQLQARFDAGERAIHRALAGLNVKRIPAEAFRDVDPDLRSLENLNTPEDYERAVLGIGDWALGVRGRSKGAGERGSGGAGEQD